MTRNVYLGADVGPAMKLLPNFSAAAEFMWKQVKQTDFKYRSQGLVREIKSARPDVVALQEATVWVCTPHVWSKKTVVYDFTAQLLDSLQAEGLSYKLAAVDGNQAFNTGFAINPIPGLTMVNDPETFMPLFGTTKAACGFRIADALLVRSDAEVVNVGTTEYEKSYTIIPTFMTVYRGYVWADVKISGNTIRFIATHLESLFDADAVPVAKYQADQLVQDTAETRMPLVVMGDFNSDPRDPRGIDDPNPGEQPQANANCQAQVNNPTSETASAECNAYWTMVDAGFVDNGPDSLDAQNFTWGYDALLQGPATSRPDGMTDRLDYVFTKNLPEPMNAQIFGNRFPLGDGVWDCAGQPCAASDHAGLSVTIELPRSTQVDSDLPEHRPFPIGFWKGTSLAVVMLFGWRIRRRLSKNS